MIFYKDKHKPHDSLVTSKLFLWKKTKKGYIDSVTGLLWYEKEPKKYSYDDAMKEFNNIKRLPTKLEWEEAENHGIREIFDDFKDDYFWSSSVHPDYSDYAYDFDGRYGVIYYVYDRAYYDHSVRCVAAR